MQTTLYGALLSFGDSAMPMQENHLVTKHLTIKCCEDVTPGLFVSDDEVIVYCCCCDTTLLKFKKVKDSEVQFSFQKGE